MHPKDEFELRRRLAVAWNDGSLQREFPEQPKHASEGENEKRQQ